MIEKAVVEFAIEQLAYGQHHVSNELRKLALADAIIWQTVHIHHAALYTQDVDLKGLPHVKFKAKKPKVTK